MSEFRKTPCIGWRPVRRTRFREPSEDGPGPAVGSPSKYSGVALQGSSTKGAVGFIQKHIVAELLVWSFVVNLQDGHRPGLGDGKHCALQGIGVIGSCVENQGSWSAEAIWGASLCGISLVHGHSLLRMSLGVSLVVQVG